MRTAGGMEKITVAIVPGTRPVPKKITAGIRYTNAGSVCMKSSTGRTSAASRSLLAMATPSGRPTPSAASVAAITSPSVSMDSGHRSMPMTT